MVKSSNIPSLLQQNGLFCCWRLETRKGSDKPTKVPYNPRTGGKAMSTNRDTFAPLPDALDALKHGNYDGLGVGIFGSLGAIDIDHCIDENGVVSEMAVDIGGIMGCYTEKSPSGTGLRMLFTVPQDFRYDIEKYYINNQKSGLEVYIAGVTSKYVSVTGDALAPLDLEERGARLQAVLDKYMVRPVKATGQSHSAVPAVPVSLEDAELIAKAKRSKNGATFAALMDGDTSAYDGDDSRADLALCNILAFWTGKDATQMDRIFRMSGLMRPKWDERHGADTYGNLTIQDAITTSEKVYDPRSYFKSVSNTFTVPTSIPAIPDVPDTKKKSKTLEDFHPEKNNRYAWSDIGNGNLFADWYKDIARYVPERKCWYVYNGGVWAPDIGGVKVMEFCKQLADALAIYALSLPEGADRDKYREFVERWQKRYNRETILKDALSVYPVNMEEFDQNEYLFNCKNGTLDLNTHEFRPHSPNDMLTHMSGVKYDKNARSLLWEKVIDDVTQSDKDKAAYLQKVLGYGLTGDT